MARALVVILLLLALGMAGTVVAPLTAPSVDGLGCGGSANYHVHASLSIVADGHVYHPPANVGFSALHLCFYWMHTHDASGIIHIEAPHRLSPTLGQFFAVWGQPLTVHRVAGRTVPKGKYLRMYIGYALYHGNPSAIRLGDHTSVTLEIGPPFRPPIAGLFAGLS